VRGISSHNTRLVHVRLLTFVSDGVCLCEPAANVPKVVTIDGQTYAVTASPAASKHRIQKPLQRQGSVTMPKNIVQAIAKDTGPGGDGHSPWLNVTYEGPRSLNENERHNSTLENPPEEQKPRLRLGMMGVGGYGAGKDTIGWQGSWPDLQQDESKEHQYVKNAPQSCCSKGPEQPQTQSSSKSCCGDQSRQQPLAHGLPMSNFPGSETVASLSLYESEDSFSSTSQRQAWNHEITETGNDELLPIKFLRHSDAFHTSPSSQSRSVNATAIPDQPLESFQKNGSSPPIPTRQQRGSGQSLYSSHLRNGSGISMHTCNCGDLCKCFSCPTHPDNTTTRTRMQELGHIMTNEEHEIDSDRSGSRPHTAYGGITSWPGNSTTNPQTSYSSDVSAFSANLPNGASNGFDTMDSSGQQFLFQNVRMGLNYDQAIMSPSTYVNVEYEYPLGWNDCSNFLGSCRCGDDCMCEGCLTHSGHNGVSLDMTAGHVGKEINIGAPGLPHSSAASNGFATSQYSEALNGGNTDSFHNGDSGNSNYGRNFGFGEHSYTNGHA
jgi:hypothetical protein